MRALSDTLRSFVRWHSRGEVLTLQSQFDWCDALVAPARRFVGYTWGKPLRADSIGVYGICPVGVRWPADLREFENMIFKPANNEPAFHSRSGAGVVDHFIIIKLSDARSAQAYLAMLIDSRDWSVLDEHTVSIKP